MTLIKDDIAFLADHSAGSSRETKPKTSLTIRDNEASLYALQVNTPVGVDVWKDVDSITIERNKATNHASQFNAPILVDATFLAIVQARKAETLLM